MGFVATRPGLMRWPGVFCDDFDLDDDPEEVFVPVNLWYGPRGPVLDWQRLTIPMDVNDRLDRRGWVARYGHRSVLSYRKDRKAVHPFANCAEATPAKQLKRKGSHAQVVELRSGKAERQLRKREHVNRTNSLEHAKGYRS